MKKSKILFISFLLSQLGASSTTLHGMQKKQVQEQKLISPSVATKVLLTGCVLYNLAQKANAHKIAQTVDSNKVTITHLRNAKSAVKNFFAKK
jgi:heme/copper-type cytochrome/quinol oxidase subunit 3